MEHRAGVWLARGNWTGSVRHPRSSLGHQRSDSAVSQPARPREGTHTQSPTTTPESYVMLSRFSQHNNSSFSPSDIFQFYLSDHCCCLSVYLAFSYACLCFSTCLLVSPSTLSFCLPQPPPHTHTHTHTSMSSTTGSFYFDNSLGIMLYKLCIFSLFLCKIICKI